MGQWHDQIMLHQVFRVKLFQVIDSVNISADVAAVTRHWLRHDTQTHTHYTQYVMFSSQVNLGGVGKIYKIRLELSSQDPSDKPSWKVKRVSTYFPHTTSAWWCLSSQLAHF